MRTFLTIALSSLVLSSLALADEHWVDPVGGEDSNGGTSEIDAWRTITRAVAGIGNVLDGADTVFLLPGTYEQANGEVFPLTLRAGLTLQGVEGSSATHIRGEMFENIFQVSGDNPAPTLLRGLDLQTGASGVFARSGFPGLQLVIEDSVFAELGVGISTAAELGEGTIELTVRSARFEYNGSGTRLLRAATARFSDCLFLDNASGISVTGLESAPGTGIDLRVERCEFRENNVGLRLSSSGSNGPVRSLVTDTMIAGNSFFTGILFLSPEGSFQTDLVRTTIAGHSSGIFLVNGLDTPISIQDCVVGANGTDFVSNPTQISFDNSLIGVDEFVDSATGDFRLRYGSHAVDRGQAPSGALDLRGQARDVDGDGDLVEASDLGALELRTLSSPVDSVLPGEVVPLELFGEAGGSSLVFVQRGPAASGQATPFGTSFLSMEARVFAVVALEPGPHPTSLSFPVPDVSQVSGQRVTFQALSSSANAPTARAFTTPLTVEIR